MSELLKIMISLSLSGTLLLFILLALKPLYKNKLSKGWQYYIWLIVVARMLLPFTPETTLVGSLFQHLDNINVGTSQIFPTTNDTPLEFASGDGYITSSAEQRVSESAATVSFDTVPSFSIQAILSKVYENLWVLWIAVAFALLIRKMTIYQSFVRFVKAGRAEVSDIRILNMLADVGETIGVKRPIELFTNPLVSSPMMLGFFRPYIILPSIEPDETALAYIMRHELIHYKHLDMFYKWLMQITVCLHWFNPFAYRLAKEINKDCEFFCDETMIRTMNEDEKKVYGDILLNSLNERGNYNDKLAAVTLTEGAEQLKERLDAIIKFKKASKTTAAIMCVITLVFAVGATAMGAYATVPINQTPPASWAANGENSGNAPTLFQASYYQAPYIFEIGQKLNENERKSYQDKTIVTLTDKASITVFFDASCKEYAKDEKALAALKTLMEKFEDSALPMKSPLVCSVDYVGNSDLNKLAEEYYSGDAMNKLIAIFSELEVSIQKMYCDMMYADDKIAFFATALQMMNADTIIYYVKKAYTDGKEDFLALMLPLLSDEEKSEWIVTIAPDLLTKAEMDGQTSQWLEQNLKLIPNVMNQTQQNAVSNGERIVSCDISFNGYDSMTTQVHVISEVETGADDMNKTFFNK